MKCVILQPSYIPWRGFFHQIQKADTFIFLDDVQYDTNGWRNRNRIKTRDGVKWLTIPVFEQGIRAEARPVRDVRIVWDRQWAHKHWTAIRHSYARAPHFQRYEALLARLYERHDVFLADLTIDMTLALAQELGLGRAKFLRASELHVEGAKTDRLLALLQKVGASHYISGPSARAYIEEEKLAAAGVSLEYMTYDYPEYEQLYPPFDPEVSILDLLFMQGEAAGRAIWGDEEGR